MRFYSSRSGTADASSFLGDLLDTLTERGRALLGRKGDREAIPQLDLIAMSELLLSRRGEASGVALAQTLLASYGT
ncbi:MCD, Malonyl-CoA decarboxylase MCD, partial [Microvirga arabica]|nr:MCD, Malonyl-CoA decarboxylase MCD [Microvirga arabica]